MMRRGASFLAGILASTLLVLTGMAWAVNGGGIPYFLRLGSLGVGTAAPTTVGNLATNGQITMGPTVSGAPNSGFVDNLSFISLAGNTTGEQLFDSGAASGSKAFSIGEFSGSLHIRPCTDNFGSCSSDAITILHAGYVEINTQPVSYGVYASNTGGCTLQGNASLNLGSCTRNVGGDNTISFVTAYPEAPSCTATQTNGIGFAQTITTTTTVEVKTYDSAGAGADRTYAVVCL